MKREEIRHPFGITVSAVTVDEFISRVISWAHPGSPLRLITYINAHCVNLYFKDAEYANIVDKADLVYADGQAVVWAARFLGEALPERINAGDFFLRFCRLCAREGLSLYLLGSQPGVAQKAAGNIRAKIPDLKIAGTMNGFFQPGEIFHILADIRESKPAILLIGMGVPLQERFAAAHIKEFGVPVVWCVGALFEYYARVRARAPVWIRRIGMEWLFRLIIEPRRLWRRYIIGNVVFIIRTLRHRFGE